MTKSSSNLDGKISKLVEVRPGRQLFVRNRILRGSNQTKDAVTTSRKIRLLCVHGTAAQHDQFLSFLKALDARLAEQNGASSLCSSQLVIDAWVYDAVGCGRSPPLADPAAYCDEEQVQDLHALIHKFIYPSSSNNNEPTPLVMLGHSYGPNWIYKYLTSKPITSMAEVAGLILISSGLENPKYQLQTGGPMIFRILPLWILKCLQPVLTQSFLKIGFASHTHRHNPQLILQAKQSNNQNDMQIVSYYYQSHEWFPNWKDLEEKYCGKPPLVLHGVEDQVVPIVCGQDLANRWGVDLTEVNHASHMVLEEQPHVVAEHVMNYLVDL